MIKFGQFKDDWRGDGVHFSFGKWTLAARLRCHFYMIRPPAKPGYLRIYFGPFEIEHRNF